MSEYPKWRYQKGQSRIFMSEHDEKQFGGIWHDTPTLADALSDEAVPANIEPEAPEEAAPVRKKPGPKPKAP